MVNVSGQNMLMQVLGQVQPGNHNMVNNNNVNNGVQMNNNNAQVNGNVNVNNNNVNNDLQMNNNNAQGNVNVNVNNNAQVNGNANNNNVNNGVQMNNNNAQGNVNNQGNNDNPVGNNIPHGIKTRFKFLFDRGVFKTAEGFESFKGFEDLRNKRCTVGMLTCSHPTEGNGFAILPTKSEFSEAVTAGVGLQGCTIEQEVDPRELHTFNRSRAPDAQKKYHVHSAIRVNGNTPMIVQALLNYLANRGYYCHFQVVLEEVSEEDEQNPRKKQTPKKKFEILLNYLTKPSAKKCILNLDDSPTLFKCSKPHFEKGYINVAKIQEFVILHNVKNATELEQIGYERSEKGCSYLNDWIANTSGSKANRGLDELIFQFRASFFCEITKETLAYRLDQFLVCPVWKRKLDYWWDNHYQTRVLILSGETGLGKTHYIKARFDSEYGHFFFARKDFTMLLGCQKTLAKFKHANTPFAMLCDECDPGDTWGKPSINTLKDILDVESSVTLPIKGKTGVEVPNCPQRRIYTTNCGGFAQWSLAVVERPLVCGPNARWDFHPTMREPDGTRSFADRKHMGAIQRRTFWLECDKPLFRK